MILESFATLCPKHSDKGLELKFVLQIGTNVEKILNLKKKKKMLGSDLVSNHADFLHSVYTLLRLPEQKNSNNVKMTFMSF